MSLQANRFNEFEQAINTTVQQSVVAVMQAATNHALSAQQIADLSRCLREAYPNNFNSGAVPVDDPEYGADFDLTAEINSQIRIVRALRSKVLSDNGSIKEDVSIRDARELITSGGAMLRDLVKYHERTVNLNRMRMVESATIEAIKTLPEDSQQQFFELLERQFAEAGI